MLTIAVGLGALVGGALSFWLGWRAARRVGDEEASRLLRAIAWDNAARRRATMDAIRRSTPALAPGDLVRFGDD